MHCRYTQSALCLRMLSSALVCVAVVKADGQNSEASAPVTFTAEQDHQNMMDQLDIRKLRNRSSGDDKSANHANDDESLANPYPDLPDPLRLSSAFSATKISGCRMTHHANAAQIPTVNTGLLNGQLACRQHDGGHTDARNVSYVLQWADKWRQAGPLPVAP